MKNFILDTNVLLHDPQAVFKFQDNNIFIPITVIEEVDRFKKDMNETGRNARQISRILDTMREKGSLASGITMPGGGMLRVELFSEKYYSNLPVDLRVDSGDNRILGVALAVRDRHPDLQLIFVTKDTNLVGVACQDNLGALSNPGDNGLDLMRSQILRLIDNQVLVRNRAAADVGQRLYIKKPHSHQLFIPLAVTFFRFMA